MFEEVEDWEQLLIVWYKLLSDIGVLDYEGLQYFKGFAHNLGVFGMEGL